MSKLLFTTNKVKKSDADKSIDRLIRAGYCIRHCSGIYSYGPLAVRVIDKINCIIDLHMGKIGCQKVFMPLLQSMDIWRRSGREDKYGSELFRLKDRHNRGFCLAPTAEETAVEMAEQICTTKEHYPFSIYQTRVKYRDELRPRGGLLRGREFTMKDAYSFTLTEEDALRQYKEYVIAYINIFNALHIDFYVVPADTGAVGGKFSHEFIAVASQCGSEDVHYDENYNHNTEDIINLKFLASREPIYSKRFKGIELGHTYLLGQLYSRAMNMIHPGDDYPYMGCYGIGVSRILAYILLEKKYLPSIISPFKFHIIILINKFNKALMDRFMNLLDKELSHDEILIDDRNKRFGTKKADHELIGIPNLIIIGDNFEFINYNTNQKKTFDDLNSLISFCKCV